MIHKKFKIPLYFGDFHIIQLENSTDIIPKNYLVEEFLSYGAYATVKIINGYHTCAIVFNKCTHNIIAHEALHTTNFILKHAGISPDFDNDEAQAYLLG